MVIEGEVVREEEQAVAVVPEPNVTGREELQHSAALLPWPHDDEKSRYFGYLVRGFSVYEALNLINRTKPCLSVWRRDKTFTDIEARIPELRRELAHEFAELEFLRNMTLVLEKDRQVLRRSLGMEKDGSGEPVMMTASDHSYLLRIRQQYSPQQLQILEQLTRSESGGKGGFNFAEWVATHQSEVTEFSRTDTVRVKSGG